MTAQKTFWSVPVTEYRSSQNSAASAAAPAAGSEVFVHAVNGAVKLTLPLLPTHRPLNAISPNGIENGGVI